MIYGFSLQCDLIWWIQVKEQIFSFSLSWLAPALFSFSALFCFYLLSYSYYIPFPWNHLSISIPTSYDLIYSDLLWSTLFCSASFYSILFFFVLYCSILFCTVLPFYLEVMWSHSLYYSCMLHHNLISI